MNPTQCDVDDDAARFAKAVDSVVANSGLVAAVLPKIVEEMRSPDGAPLGVEDHFARRRWHVAKECQGGPSIVFGKPPLQENPKNALDREMKKREKRATMKRVH